MAFVQTWVEQKLFEQGVTATQLSAAASRTAAASQLSITNSIGSLRFIDAMDWKDFVESLSVVEQTLRDDPGGCTPARILPPVTVTGMSSKTWGGAVRAANWRWPAPPLVLPSGRGAVGLHRSQRPCRLLPDRSRAPGAGAGCRLSGAVDRAGGACQPAVGPVALPWPDPGADRAGDGGMLFFSGGFGDSDWRTWFLPSPG